MRMKMFAAETLEAAKALVFAEMGDDAVILSERVTERGVELRAATDRMGAVSGEPNFLHRIAGRQASQPVNAALRQRVRDALLWHGAPAGFSARIGDAIQHDRSISEPADAIAIGLQQMLEFRPLPPALEHDIVLVGAPGHGRTATAAKLTRRAAAARAAVWPVAADLDATAGGDQLAAYLARERERIRVAQTPEDLFALLRALREDGARAVIDLPAIVPFDRADMAGLSDLIAAISAEPVLVLSAEGHPDDQAEAVRAFAGVGVRRAILTKLDVARRRGGAVAALAQAGIALSHLAVTPFIGGGLIPAAPSRLASLLIEDTPGQLALKGAAA